jgi:peptidoglycan/xylan/chitin deacetylase (PgdA/CDA1 family)
LRRNDSIATVAPRRPPRPRSALVRVSAGLHLAGAATIVAAPATWPWVAGCILADHALLVAGSLWPRSTLVGPNVRRLGEAAARARAVALTFDDGPDPRVTPRVLDLLDARRARATFFCVARRAEENPGLVAEIARRGHRVENHSYAHANGFCFLGPRAAGRDIDRAQAVLGEQAGAAPRWFRAPAGLRNPWLAGVLETRGLALVSWTRRGLDASARDAPRVLRRLTRGLAAGDILVLHDAGPWRLPGGGHAGLETLPRLLDAVESAGLRAVPLPPPAEALAHD